jgi:2-polyprenyl-6-methoxyphenol hydroxylase-like FAD-dependent oxidoreductase
MATLKDRYDVIVIGAGIGGLTCGALLAKKGLSVLVAEQYSRPGGYCTSFQRKGFTFGTGFDATLECEKGGVCMPPPTLVTVTSLLQTLHLYFSPIFLTAIF